MSKIQIICIDFFPLNSLSTMRFPPTVVFILFFTLSTAVSTNAAVNQKLREATISNHSQLILTPYIIAQEYARAKSASLVDLRDILQDETGGGSQSNDGGFKGIESYSGFLTVNETFNSNLFFWFFPATENPIESPVILYLSGGPGSPSVSEAFNIGPLELDENSKVRRRSHSSWTDKHSVIFVDSPVGAGYSFTKDPNGFSHNDDDIAENLYEALTQFFKVFSNFRKQPFFIAGSSFAGKIAPALALKIHNCNRKKDPVSENRINFNGIFLMSPLLDPIGQLSIASTHYSFGLVDERTRKELTALENLAIAKAKAGDYSTAFFLTDSTYGTAFNKTSIFTQKTGYSSIFEGLLTPNLSSERYASRKVISSAKFRKVLHLDEASPSLASGSPQLLLALLPSIFDSAKANVETLLQAEEGYKVMVLNGQLDILTPVVSLDSFFRDLHWTHLNAFSNSDRKIMWGQKPLERQIAGYYKEFENLSRVMIWNAGHNLWFDQLGSATRFLTYFTHAK